MGNLSALQPKAVFEYFEKICSIPHGSGNVSGLVDYCVDFAEKRNLSWYRDEANNLVIYKAASPGYEQADVMILQGHTDMVCEKDADKVFDFTKDAIEAYVDGEYIRAKGTTLGGDNGIAVAMCLALLDDDTLEHPPLEVFFTADEEIGLVGAFAFDCSHLTGHKLINLDSECEGVLMCSCAGGANAYSTLPISRETKSVQRVEIKISGLKSGHSGVEIDKGRANSNVLMARLLHSLKDTAAFNLINLKGGSRETAIASMTVAEIGVASSDTETVVAAVNNIGSVFQNEYATAEPEMAIAAVPVAEEKADVLTAESTALAINTLLSLPDGVQAMSVDMPGLVQTSLNFGILELRDDEMYFANTVRSSMTTQKKWILDQVQAVVSLAGGKTEIAGSYPGWSYNPNSVVKDTVLQVYKRLFNKEATVDAVHAGIECGLFADSIVGLDCVSIGPDMADVHTPREHLSIPSVQRTYELLREVLKESK